MTIKSTPARMLSDMQRQSGNKSLHIVPTPTFELRTDKLKCPRGLHRYARDEWNKVVPQLIEQGLVNNLHHSALLVYCVTFGQWKEFTELSEQLLKDKQPKLAAAAAVQANISLTHIKTLQKSVLVTPESTKQQVTAAQKKTKGNWDKFR